MLIDKSQLFEDNFTPYGNGNGSGSGDGKDGKKRKVDFLVLHHIGGREGDEDDGGDGGGGAGNGDDAQMAKDREETGIATVEQAIETLKNEGVSSHYIVGADGRIYQLVEENDIAWHAGHSFWRGEESLNKNSIGIEMFSADPFNQGFTKRQMDSLAELCRSVVETHNIEARNVVGHCDIACFPEIEPYISKGLAGFLDRKQDPSHMFDWHALARNGVGVFHNLDRNKADDNCETIGKMGEHGKEIAKIRQRLREFGYKITTDSDRFDEELRRTVNVFNRRFLPQNMDDEGQVWRKSCELALGFMLQALDI